MATALLIVAGSAGAAENVYFTAKVDGGLTIGPQGDVLEVRLDDVDWMGEAVVQGYRQKILAWRFEPVLENGKPVATTGEMELDLVAVRDEASGTAQFAIERVTFPDNPGRKALAEKQEPLRRPVYPDIAARNGIGARVVLVARVNADGETEDVAVEHLVLTGPNPGNHAKRMASGFERSTVAAARYWRLRGIKPGDLVRVPVKFAMAGVAPPPPGWERVTLVPLKSPRWLVQARSANEAIVELADSGEASTSKLRLLTRLESGFGG